ncbi:TetR/AcrR family transcriptional regulator [Allokutzneria oryzae]|uniref:TetR/AcrR family transcriptional regulator n=1 Tax=Allokutzneria oryzae TaxID=1378989 RepID=A0ABV6A061_9PSEU
MTRLSQAERREQIVAAARRVLVEQGVPAATTRRIAAEAQVHVGLLHYHFATKDELFAAVMSQITADLVDYVRTASPEEATIQRCVHDLLTGAMAAEDSLPGIELAYLQLTIALMRSPELSALATAKYQTLLDALAERFRATPNPPEDPDQLALVFLTVLDGLVVLTSALPEAGGLLAAAERTILSGAGSATTA